MTREKKRPEEREEPDGTEMSLSGHLRELRNRLLICLVLLFTAVGVGLHFAPLIVEKLLSMGEACGYSFVYIAPQELLMQYFSVALVLGVVVAFPVICYETWAFVSPGLKRNENRIFLFAMVFGLVCFCVGVAFAYKVMLPFMLEFLITLGVESTALATISVANYMTFFTTMFLIFGIMFELPMLSLLLNRAGLIKVIWMRKGRKVVTVAIFVISAVITPPDIVSQIMVAIPMLALYELSIVLCRLLGTNEQE